MGIWIIKVNMKKESLLAYNLQFFAEDMGFGGKTTVLGTYLNIGNQRASGVRIVSIRPSCFVEPRVATLKL